MVPAAGIVMVWARLLSPSGSAPEARPRSAEPVPVWAVVEATGARTPPVVQEASPDSNPPLATPGAGAAGVTGADAADPGDVPTALVAVTVKV
ncbi:hypothetical protein AB0323_13120 [Arthrobacter sp. NPDC080031]|uniref:hypothetical protein n=1 Tax=Arthrobacter sp. NPDC080031 TaxID=3155918 RepID=UPI0034503E2F